MCAGQVGNLLPRVALSALLAQHLMPAWGLSAAEGGLMASGYAFGYMLAVPVLTTLNSPRITSLCFRMIRAWWANASPPAWPARRGAHGTTAPFLALVLSQEMQT
jgi:hypothetical protein